MRSSEACYQKISKFRHDLNVVVCFLLGNSPASEFYMPTFRDTLSVPSSQAGSYEEILTCLRRWNRVSRNVGIYNSEAGELPRRKHTTCCQKLVSVRLHIQICNYNHMYEHIRVHFHEARHRCQSLCLGTLLTPGRHRLCDGDAESVTWCDFFRLSQFYKNFTRETLVGVCFCRQDRCRRPGWQEQKREIFCQVQ